MSKEWKFITNHGAVLACIAKEPTIRVSDIAARVGITERAVQRIVADLVEAGYVSRARRGRRNHYEFHPGLSVRRPELSDRAVDELIAMLSAEPASRYERG